MSGDLEDNADIRERVREAGLHSDEAHALLSEFASDIATEAKGIAPKRTGRMSARIRWSVSDSVGGMTAKITAPAPANLLATRSGIRWQTRAWGHVVRLSHVAHFPFLRISYDTVRSLYDE